MSSKFKKYLIVSENDKKWGFYIRNLGKNIIKENTDYPSKDHPDDYVFSWNKGRVIYNEFHMVLITDGQGEFESTDTGVLTVNNGDLLLLFPGQWHRYRPLKKVGWTERWIGFSGQIAHELLYNGFFSSSNTIIPKCNTNIVLNLFDRLYKTYDDESYGFQQTGSGICFQLIAEINIVKNGGNSINQHHHIVDKVKKIMYQNINYSISLEEIASTLKISYSKLRKDFKIQTGVAPLQYFLLLKIEKSKELLLNTNKSQKEIAYQLGFDSDYYFNRLFKKKTGVSPGNYRNNLRK